MPDEKKIIDQIIEELKNTKDDTYASSGSDSRKDGRSSRDISDAGSTEKPCAISFIEDIEYTAQKYKAGKENEDLFKSWRAQDGAEGQTTTYFKRSRFQPKPIKFEETEDIIERATAIKFPSNNSSADTKHYINGENRACADDGVRSFKGQSEFDPTVNNEKSRIFFSRQIVERRISKPGKTDDVFAASTITPERQLSNTFTDEIAGIVRKSEAKESAVYSEVVEGQIRLTGFDEESEPEKVNDEFVAEQLRATRLKKISEFNARKIFDVEDAEEDDELLQGGTEEKSDGGDFVNPNEPKSDGTEKSRKRQSKPPENKDIFKMLSGRYRVIAKKTLALVCIEALNTLLFFLFPHNGSVVLYALLNIILLLAAGALCFDMFVSGVKSIRKKQLTVNFTTLTAYAAAFIQNIVFFTVSHDHTAGDINSFQLGVILILLLRSWGKLSVEERIKNNFQNLSSFKEIYAVSEIKDAGIAEQIYKGAPDEKPNIIYSSKAKHISDFLKTSYKDDSFEKKYAIVSVVLTSLSFIISVITLISGAGMLNASTVFAALTCFSVPSATLLCSNLPLLILSNKLKNSGVILSYDASEQCIGANALALDVCSLYPKSHCSLYGIKTYNSMPLDHAILLITSALVAAENPLAGVFADIIEGKTAILPEVEQCNYEDKLGISAWIDGKRILVGNRDMMTHRGIDILTPQVERKYLKNDRKILYLAVENVLSAMFVVSFKPDEKVVKYIKMLQDNDVTILARSTEPNITEQQLAHDFEAYETTFKILGSRQAEIYRRYNKATHSKVSTSIAHTAGARAMLKTVASSLKLKSVLKTAFRINITGTLVCFFWFAVSALIDSSVLISAPYLLVFILLITALACFIPSLIRR